MRQSTVKMVNIIDQELDALLIKSKPTYDVFNYNSYFDEKPPLINTQKNPKTRQSSLNAQTHLSKAHNSNKNFLNSQNIHNTTNSLYGTKQPVFDLNMIEPVENDISRYLRYPNLSTQFMKVTHQSKSPLKENMRNQSNNDIRITYLNDSQKDKYSNINISVDSKPHAARYNQSNKNQYSSFKKAEFNPHDKNDMSAHFDYVDKFGSVHTAKEANIMSKPIINTMKVNDKNEDFKQHLNFEDNLNISKTYNNYLNNISVKYGHPTNRAETYKSLQDNTIHGHHTSKWVNNKYVNKSYAKD